MSEIASTILVADEHDSIRAFLADNLAADGYRVLVAPDRAKALALLSTQHPDLILVASSTHYPAPLDLWRAGLKELLLAMPLPRSRVLLLDDTPFFPHLVLSFASAF